MLDPLAPPWATEPVTPPWPIDQLTSLCRLAPSAPPGTAVLTPPPGSLIPQALLWSAVTLPAPWTSSGTSAVPPYIPFGSVGLLLPSGFRLIPLAPWLHLGCSSPQLRLGLQALLCHPVLSSPWLRLGLQLFWLHPDTSHYWFLPPSPPPSIISAMVFPSASFSQFPSISSFAPNSRAPTLPLLGLCFLLCREVFPVFPVGFLCVPSWIYD